MSNWNQDYGQHKQYGAYQNEPGYYDTYILVGVVGILVLFGGIIGYNVLKQHYTTSQIVGGAVACVIVTFIAGTVAWGVVWSIYDWWDRKSASWFGGSYDTGNTQKTAQNAYNQGAPANKVAKPIKPVKAWKRGYLLAGEREMPPRAQFFGRLDGQPVDTTGLYEEQWLNEYELEHWFKRKEHKKAVKDGLTNEKDEHDHIVVNSTTKIDI